MGQRFQFYVQVLTGNYPLIIAKHLQWCYSYYAIDRAYNLINYIEINLSRFYEGNEKDIIDGVTAAIEYNPESYSWQKSCDLIKEQREIVEERNEVWFKLNPFYQDNNDGIFVVVVDPKNEKISYAFDLMSGKNNKYFPITATEYLSHYLERYMECYKGDEEKASYKEEVSNFQVTFPAANEISQHTLLTREDLIAIFGKAYRYRTCLRDSYNDFADFAKKTTIELSWKAKSILDNRYFAATEEIGKKIIKTTKTVLYIPTPEEVLGLRKEAVIYIDIAAGTAETVLIKKKPTFDKGVDFLNAEGTTISKTDFSLVRNTGSLLNLKHTPNGVCFFF